MIDKNHIPIINYITQNPQKVVIFKNLPLKFTNYSPLVTKQEIFSVPTPFPVYCSNEVDGTLKAGEAYATIL